MKMQCVHFFLSLVLVCVDAQSLQQGCPSQWETYQRNCYQFVFDQTRDYQEAATACWVQGSALVSVNDLAENTFITKYLNNHGQQGLFQWYTSGEYIQSTGSIKWNGDGSYSNASLYGNYWNGTTNVDNYLNENTISYKYSSHSGLFGWSIVSGTDPFNFICEIPRAEISRIIHHIRDFDYGLPEQDATIIPKGPTFINEQLDVVVVGSKYSVIIECVADGNPLPTYVWYERGLSFNSYSDDVYNEVPSVDNPRYTFTNGRMTISSPTESQDAGLYNCKATNNFGSILSPPVRISFGYLNEFSPNQQGFVEANLNQGTFINCNSPSAKPAVSYQWYKNTAIDFIRPELNKYLFISNNGHLYFSEVQFTDGGQYACVVTLISRMEETLSTPQPPSKTSREIELRVQGSPAMDYGPIIHNDFIAVFPKPPMIGHDIRLECFAYGRMPLRYSWSREGKRFPDGTRFELDNRVMIIPNAQFADSGNYTCTVKKTTGIQAMTSKWIILTMEAKPYFVFPLRNVHADLGSELTWRCGAMAVPHATYAWYKNSQLVQRMPGIIYVRENVLVIHTLDKVRDEGMYQCSATNAHGTSMSYAQLRVLSLKPSFAKNPLPTTMVVSNGGNLTIHCTPEAAPQPDITWLHNGQSIGYGDSRQQILLDGTLHVTQVSYSDQGVYTCKAFNINGEEQSNTQVTVIAGPAFQMIPSNTVGAVNRTVFLYCQASYDSNTYDLTYFWKFNGRIINTKTDLFYRQDKQRQMNGLYIVNAQYKHTGMYECIAQTVMSSISARAMVQITGPPGEPAGVYVEAGSAMNQSLLLIWTWNPEANNGYPVTYFDIEAITKYSPLWTVILLDISSQMTLIPNSEMKHSTIIHNLLPYNSYRFRVGAKNEKGVGPPSTPSARYNVPSAVPTKPPSDVGGGGGSVGSLSITWQSLDRSEEGGIGFGYNVYWRLGNQTTTRWSMKYVGNQTSHSVTVGADNFFLIYEVKVQAYNTYGVGPESPVAYVYSAEGIPLAVPTNVKSQVINGTAALITWDQVPNDRLTLKGQVLGYEIDNSDAFNQNGQSGSINIYCVCGQGLIIGLEPNCNYWVNVEVFNTAGTGTPSEKYQISMNEEPPGRYPQFVDIYPHGIHSILLKWRGVSTTLLEAGLSGYKIMYWPVNDDIRTAKVTLVGKETTCVIYDLQWDIIYKLRVMAYNRGGDGKKSPTLYFIMLKGGVVHINRATFDPSTSEFLIASAWTIRRSFIPRSLCYFALFCVYHFVQHVH